MTDNGGEQPCWKIMVHPLADADMRAMKREHPDVFADMMAGLKELAITENLFSLPRDTKLDLCHIYPEMRGQHGLRFKRRRAQWRVVLRYIHNGVPTRADERTRPEDGDHLQIVFANVRTGQTYGVALAERARSI